MKASEHNLLEPACAFLKGLKLETIDRKNEQHVVVLYEQMTLEQALLALAGRHILSAPVLTGRSQDASRAGAMQFQHDRDVVGFLDVRDILLNLLTHLGNVHELMQMPMLKRMQALEAAGAVFSRKLVSDIHAYGSDGNFLHSGQKLINADEERCQPSWPGHHVSPLIFVIRTVMIKRELPVEPPKAQFAWHMRAFVTTYCHTAGISLWELVYSSLLHPSRRRVPESGRTSAVHHRIALFDSTCKITQIISQTDIMRALHANKDKIGECLKVKLVDVPGLCSGSLVKLSASRSALEALEMMRRYDVSAVAVVDEGGRLMGSFSMSAMRSIVVEHFGALALPVAEFLALACGEPGAHEYADHLADELREVEGSDAGGRNLHYVRGAYSRGRSSVDAGRNAYLSRDGTVEDMLDVVVRRKVHRVYVVAANGTPLATATLTDLIYSIAGEQPTGRPQL